MNQSAQHGKEGQLGSAYLQRLLLTPAASVDAALGLAMPDLPADPRLGIFPRASSTIPYLE
ncbi:MAG: hypothetical protein PVG32_10890 [Anaerolineales bacterium]|jgi:hypothetical protein